MTSIQKFSLSLIVAAFITALTYSVGHYMGWISEFIPLEVFAVFTSYSCTLLCVLQSRWNYPIGVVTTLAYAAVFYWYYNLIGSAVVSLYLMFQLAYGWFRWRSDDNTLPVSRLKFDRWLLGYAAITGVTYFGAIQILEFFGASYSNFDAFIMTGSILAQFLLDNKKIETWIVWAVVNVVAIYIYQKSGASLIAMQYMIFLMNTLYGFWSWKVSTKEKSAWDK